MDEELHRAGVPLGTAPGNQWRVSTTHANLVRRFDNASASHRRCR
jgi:hypothetical protein